MGTSIVRYSDTANELSWGVLRDQQIHKLNIAAPHHKEIMRLYFGDRETLDAAIGQSSVAQSEVRLRSPLDQNIQLFAQGLNYADHRAESGMSIEAEEEENLIFLKGSSSLCGPNDTILRPVGCELLDYEIELGIVLKRDVQGPIQVNDENIGEYVGGLILCNDVSARDFMFGAPMIQWYKGKSQRTFCPAGPVLYLLDEVEIEQMYSLELSLWMNGELKQNAVVEQLIHKPPKTLQEISVFSDLNAGDCVLTGTPGGVLAGHSLKAGLSIMLNLTNDQKRRKKFVAAQKAQASFLQPGDVIELEIKSPDGGINLGRQRNEIADK